MRLSRRSLVGLGVAASTAAAAASMIATTAPAGAKHLVADHAAGSFVGVRLKPDPPLGRAKPAATAPNLAPTGPSPWVQLKHPPPFTPDTMLLASDGTVLVHAVTHIGNGTSKWYKLTPDSSGSYANGTWSQIPSMPSGYNPEYFASAILPDGRMIVEGGEYLGGTAAWTNKGAIYNPVNDTWKSVAPPPGWTNIGDAQSDVLANGTFMLSQACQNCLSSNFILTTDSALFNATGLNWNPIGGAGKNDPNDEEGWTLEPNGKLLTVDTWLTPTTELFSPTSLSWAFAGNTSKSPVNAPSAEIGPAIEMPGGNTLVVGAGSGPENPAPCTTHTPAPTQLYNYAAGRWVNGPPIPTIGGMQYDSADGPGSILPDGNVLFDVSPCVFNAPIVFYEYNPGSNTLTPVQNIPNAANDSTYYTRLLALPNGQVLFNDESKQMLVYTAGGTPDPSWAPSITSVSPTTLDPGQRGSLSGSQLAGLDPGATYGDDVQSNTNFPLVRITNSASGVVTYARTTNWSSVSIAPGTSSSTNFTVPTTAPSGPSTLEVVANGIASQPVQVTIR
jgi:hypothetical protein